MVGTDVDCAVISVVTTIRIALFTVTFSHLHYNVFELGTFCPKLPHIQVQIYCNANEKS